MTDLMSLYSRLGGHEGLKALLHPFYADIRQHQLLGPIFQAHIADWNAHIDKITEFWSRQTGGPSKYGGGFGAAHLSLGIQAAHFSHWLGLWEFNCRRQLAAQEAEEMIRLAHRIGEQLARIVSGRPGIPIR